MMSQFRNLIFEGGGVKGIAYVGAMQVLSQRGMLDDICRVGGTSAGAINALIFALGYDIREQRKILQSTDFRQFMDDSFGAIRDIRRLAKKFGWHIGISSISNRSFPLPYVSVTFRNFPPSCPQISQLIQLISF